MLSWLYFLPYCTGLTIAIVIIVWAMRPSASHSDESEAKVEQRSKWIYIWLLLSSFITVPWMIRSLPDEHLVPTDRHPAWSPDSQRIAFTCDEGICIMNADGSNQRKLTNASNSGPVWSPDGKFIAFGPGDNGNEIVVMNADGSDRRSVTNNAQVNSKPKWSPDGDLIAFSSTNFTRTQISVIKADGSNLRRLTNNVGDSTQPEWAPDGGNIAYNCNRAQSGGICIIDANGLNEQNLIKEFSVNYNPVWSPDGQNIAFTCVRGSAQICVIAANASNQRQLTSDYSGHSDPMWSPDGKFIIFNLENSSSFGGAEQIFIMSADGSKQQKLSSSGARESDAALSPDSKFIAFVSNRDGEYEIYTMNTDGRGVRKLTESASAWQFVTATGLPALIHVVLLFALFSSSLYIRRHTQQALILVALRVLSTVLLIGVPRVHNLVQLYAANSPGGVTFDLWVIVNGTLWLLGSLWGLRQVKQGDCWLMRLRGEEIKLAQ